MAQIVGYTFIIAVSLATLIGLYMRISGSAKSGKTQKLILFMFATPFVLMLTAQIVRVFMQVNPSPTLY